jgi:hypothetical protein
MDIRGVQRRRTTRGEREREREKRRKRRRRGRRRGRRRRRNTAFPSPLFPQ